MNNEDLMGLLEGRHAATEIRLAVALPGLAPVEMSVAGVVTPKSLGLPGAEAAPVAWLLSGTVTGEASPWWWSPHRRQQP